MVRRSEPDQNRSGTTSTVGDRLSLHRLQTRAGYAEYAGWHDRVRADLVRLGMVPVLREVLILFMPRAAYFPDSLTPDMTSAEIGEGLNILLHTSTTQPSKARRDLLSYLLSGVCCDAWRRRDGNGDRVRGPHR
jgi:hypothetical protein